MIEDTTALSRLPPKVSLSKQEELDKLGNYSLNYLAISQTFDPMRLKIIMLRKEEAAPSGKNPDYFFSRGVDYINSRAIDEAIRSFAKGIHDKSTHFLCRFGLGFALFTVGNFTAAAREYEVLAHQCLGLGLHSRVKFPQVLYNKSVSEL